MYVGKLKSINEAIPQQQENLVTSSRIVRSGQCPTRPFVVGQSLEHDSKGAHETIRTLPISAGEDQQGGEVLQVAARKIPAFNFFFLYFTLLGSGLVRFSAREYFDGHRPQNWISKGDGGSGWKLLPPSRRTGITCKASCACSTVTTSIIDSV